MDYSKLEGYSDAAKVFTANVSPRYVELENLDKWVHGRQYEGLTGWFEDSDKPLLERAPCFVYLLAKEAAESKVDLVLGEGRFPTITTSPGEGDPLADKKDSQEAADEAGLGQEDSKLLDAFIERAMRQCSFRAVAREVLHHGQEVGSAVVIFGVRNGKLFADTTKAQWCEPTLDVDGNVTRLEIKYPYLDPYKEPTTGTWKVRVRIYRRVIDDKTDTTYKPVDANERGIEPDTWIDDQTYPHNFGFCPVRWYPFMRGCSTVNQVDGKATHELMLDEIRCVDMSLSQRQRAAFACGDPQWTERGVQPGYNPSEPARTAVVPSTLRGGPVSATNPSTGGYVDGSTKPARKKSPSTVWQYPDKDTVVELHSLPPEALEAVTKHAADFRLKLCEMLAYVPLDPDSISHIRQLSGKALDALRRRELNRCDKIRDDLGDRFLVPSVQMLIRICAKFAEGGLNLAGLRRVKDLLSRYKTEDLTLRLIWGSYDTPDPEEEQQIVSTTCQAHDEGIITDRQAIAKVQDIFGIENVDEAEKALQAEKDKRQATAMAIAAAQPKLDKPNGKSEQTPDRTASA